VANAVSLARNNFVIQGDCRSPGFSLPQTRRQASCPGTDSLPVAEIAGGLDAGKHFQREAQRRRVIFAAEHFQCHGLEPGVFNQFLGIRQKAQRRSYDCPSAAFLGDLAERSYWLARSVVMALAESHSREDEMPWQMRARMIPAVWSIKSKLIYVYSPIPLFAWKPKYRSLHPGGEKNALGKGHIGSAHIHMFLAVLSRMLF